MFGVKVADYATQPALVADLIRLAGVPNIHGPEMRPVWVGVADAVDDGDFTVIVKLFQRSESRVKPELSVYRQDVLSGYAEVATIIVIR